MVGLWGFETGSFHVAWPANDEGILGDEEEDLVEESKVHLNGGGECGFAFDGLEESAAGLGHEYRFVRRDEGQGIQIAVERPEGLPSHLAEDEEGHVPVFGCEGQGLPVAIDLDVFGPGSHRMPKNAGEFGDASEFHRFHIMSGPQGTGME